MASTCHSRRTALSGDLMYTGTPAAAVPVSAILGLVTEIEDGLYVPEGDMGRIPEVLGGELRARGGSVTLDSPVNRIVEKGRVRGVTSRGRDIDAAAVISTTGSVPAAARRKVRNARLSRRSVSIQLGPVQPGGGTGAFRHVLPWMDQQHRMFEQDGSEMPFPVFVFPTATLPELAPEGGSIVEMFYPVGSGIAWITGPNRTSNASPAWPSKRSGKSAARTWVPLACGARTTSATGCGSMKARSTDSRPPSLRASSSLIGAGSRACSRRDKRLSPAMAWAPQ
jgi:phytoene dehydrogenase-like protein